MPIYESEETSQDALDELRRYHTCQECGGQLAVFYDADAHKAFLACTDWPRTQHEGIEREVNRYEKEGLASLNIETRRELMTEEYGEVKTKALDKYMSAVTLTKPQAKEILVSVYPDAPIEEIARAVLLCASYGLNPLMKHVFLIPFNKGKSNESWVTVIGIKAKRLLASRRDSYGYIDGTPKVMNKQMQMDTFGVYDPDKVWAIAKGKDPKTGAEAVGYGFWPSNVEPKGTDKGNSKFNMAFIRAESQMLDRLRPGEMPIGIDVMPEMAADTAIEGEYKMVDKNTGEILGGEPERKTEHWCEEHNRAFEKKTKGAAVWYAHRDGDSWCNENGKKAIKEEPEQEVLIETEEVDAPESELDFDPAWLTESLKTVNWKDGTVKSYLKNIYQAETKGAVVEIVAGLNREQREDFFKEIQSKLAGRNYVT